MSIQSLGIGSGLDLESLVTQLLRAERAPKEARLSAREQTAEATISGFGKIKSALSELQDSLEELQSASDINSRNVDTSDADEENPENQLLTATALNSALTGSYQIAVEQLARGSRFETADAISGGFSSADDVLLSGTSGSIEFGLASGGDTFSVAVTDGMTLAELRTAINDASDNFGVSANLIDTGTSDGGVKLVFMSEETGAGNDLVIRNVNDIAALQTITTTDSTSTSTYLSPVQTAQNARAVIDGITVESPSNEFQNSIAGVDLTVQRESEFAADGITRQTTQVTIGVDSDSMKEKIEAFIEKYNSVIDEIESLTQYGEGDAPDGDLVGDSLVRSIRQGLSAIVGNSVPDNDFGSLFAVGVELTSDGRLEIGSSDFGLGSGSDRLEDAIKNNFNQIAALFGKETTGVANQFDAFIEQFIESDGLIASRESAAQAEQRLLETDREQLETRMASYEKLLRDRYLNLDQTVSRLNQTGSALLASLGQA